MFLILRTGTEIHGVGIHKIPLFPPNRCRALGLHVRWNFVNVFGLIKRSEITSILENVHFFPPDIRCPEHRIPYLISVCTLRISYIHALGLHMYRVQITFPTVLINSLPPPVLLIVTRV